MARKPDGAKSGWRESLRVILVRMVGLAAELQPLCQQYGIERLALFGSQARGDATNQSDYDFRIDRGSLKGMDLFAFKHELEDVLSTQVDLITTSSMDEAFLNEAKKDEVVLYDRCRTYPYMFRRNA